MHNKFREKMDDALNNYFPKYKSKERSSALMLFSTAILHHEKTMQQVKLHLGYLLRTKQTNDSQYNDAKAFYDEIE